MTAPLLFLLITLKVIELGKLSLSDIQNFKTLYILTANDKYSLPNRDNLMRLIQLQFSQKQKAFSQLFYDFLKSALNFEYLQNKMTCRADVFPKLRTLKNVVRYLSRKSPFRGCFDRKHVKRGKTVLESELQHLYHIYWWMWTQLSWETSLLVICKILRLFVNTLTAGNKYSPLNRDNFSEPIQMNLSQKQKIFPELFCRFLKTTLKSEYSQNKGDPHCWCISEITKSQKRG